VFAGSATSLVLLIACDCVSWQDCLRMRCDGRLFASVSSPPPLTSILAEFLRNSKELLGDMLELIDDDDDGDHCVS
jgi:hypothetical protein